MKKLEVSEEFVKEAYESACKDWKERIEKEFPSLFEVKLEVGRWYKDMRENSKSFFFIEELVNGCVKDLSVKSFGLTMSGEWTESCDRNVNVFRNYFILATSEEIESMLWKEAEKRGIGKDTKLECNAVGFVDDNRPSYRIEYDVLSDTLWNKYGRVYQKGQWAKPLDPNKEIKEQIERLEKELKELKEKVK